MAKRKLTKIEIDAAKNLKLLWKAEQRERKFTQESAAAEMGWSQGAVTQYLNGHTPLALEAILKFSAFLSVEPADISKELSSLSVMLNIDSIRHETKLGSVDLVVGKSNVGLAPSIQGEVPLISWVQAGEWCGIIDSFQPGDAEEWLPYVGKMSEQSFALRVRGASMEPKYRDGDLIFVDPNKQPEHNSDVVVRLNHAGEATFKRLQIDGSNKYLIALNKTYPDPVIPMNEEAEICGVVYFYGQFA